MKTKKIEGKLTLKKETVSNLNEKEMIQVFGGIISTTSCCPPPTDKT